MDNLNQTRPPRSIAYAATDRTHLATAALLSSVLILVLCMLLSACSQAQAGDPQSGASEAASIPVAEWLPRNDGLGSAEEVESVLNQYREYSARLSAKNDADAALHLASLYIREARVTGEHGHYYPAAEAVLKSLLDGRVAMTEDERFQAQLLQATVMGAQHRFDRALALAETGIAQNPYNAAIRGVQVDALVELGRLDEAVEACDALLNLRPDLRAYSRASYIRELHDDAEGAREAMEMAVQAGMSGTEEKAWCRTQLASLYRSAGMPDEARMHLELALAERPDYPFAIAEQAAWELAFGSAEEAEQKLNRALAIIPEVGFAEDLLALYRAQGRDAEADALETEILAMYDDDMASGHVMDWDLAQFLAENTDQQARALELGQKALERRPLREDIRAFVREQQGRTSSANG